MAIRHLELSPEAEPILDSVAASFGGDAGIALSQLLLAHESVETFLDEVEDFHAEELTHQRDRSTRDFQEGFTASWEQVKASNGL
jgi:hypothetical protein